MPKIPSKVKNILLQAIGLAGFFYIVLPTVIIFSVYNFCTAQSKDLG